MRTPQDLKGTSVLVADSHVDSLELVAFFLERRGARVHAVKSAVSAVRALGAFAPHVLVTEIVFPHTDGFALMTGVRDTLQRRLPAVAVTTLASEADRTRILDHGFQVHIAKPLDLEQLATVIRELRDQPA
jgi:CheY-like chemotaxis protein